MITEGPEMDKFNDTSDDLDIEDLEIMEDLILVFNQTKPSMVAAIKDAIEKNEASLLKNSIHSFKGAVCNFTMGPITKKLQQVEEDAEKGLVSLTNSELDNLLVELDNVFSTIESKLKQ